MRMIFVALFSLCLIFFIALIFYANVNFDQFPPSKLEYYESFGSYFGGVAGALMSFVGILLVVYNLNQQSIQIQSLVEESVKGDMLRFLSAVDFEIEKLLDAKLTVAYDPSKFTLLRDIVYGLCDWNVDALKEFKPALSRLVALECSYCQALALYRDNVSQHFIFVHYRRKAAHLHDFLNKNKSRLNNNELIALDFCLIHIDGKES